MTQLPRPQAGRSTGRLGPQPCRESHAVARHAANGGQKKREKVKKSVMGTRLGTMQLWALLGHACGGTSGGCIGMHQARSGGGPRLRCPLSLFLFSKGEKKCSPSQRARALQLFALRCKDEFLVGRSNCIRDEATTHDRPVPVLMNHYLYITTNRFSSTMELSYTARGWDH